ncbi:glycosyltransferase family 2 protein [Lysinibacillus telephonicus]|uniref:glycosyltransferase family 2 protein n=1 Tax=Lysinibacillus telephonicus TaxID=1714840 RepID=UPI003BA0FEA4
MSDLVSIIMPAYNAEKFISQSIESIIRQTYDNWELIIINDCSKDSTLQICESFSKKDSRIRLITLSKNGGISNARNRGILESKGEYIAFLDSDDLWKEKKLEKQLKFMEKNDIAFSCTGYEWINSDGEKLNKIIDVPKLIEFNDLLKVNTIGCLTVLINTTKIKTFQMPHLKHEDYATWLNILKENNIKVFGLNESLAYYRKSNGSTSSNKIKTLSWTWNIYHKHLGYRKVKSTLYLLRFIINTLKKYS